jgi:type III pantothenate kinase
MILELDIGNSRIKWRQFDEISSSVIELGHVNEPGALFEIMAAAPAPVMIRSCSVRDGPINDQIRQWVAANWGLPVQAAVVSRRCAGVSNQYSDPDKLGVDRWLAMLAAFNSAAGPCVVVDSGTAMTVDIVDASGLHRGGFIVPGLKLMGECLSANTSIRLSEQHSPPTLAPGHSTDNAVRHGALAALIALIERVMKSVSEEELQAKLYLSGGDAAELDSNLSAFHAELIPGLVMDGLTFACPYPTEYSE